VFGELGASRIVYVLSVRELEQLETGVSGFE
jgi:hypothetical protein